MTSFHAENKACWEATLNAVFPSGIPDSASWTDLDRMIRVLGRFCTKDLNHTMLPRGGGLNMDGLARSREPDCLEFRFDDRVAYLCQPTRLYFEHIAQAPSESFFLLDTARLAPSGLYETLSEQSEELLELPNGEYMMRGYLDCGYIGHDANGDKIPIPDSHRLVVRHLAGKFLIVATRSLWNLDPLTYDGRHNRMTHCQIRNVIEAALKS